MSYRIRHCVACPHCQTCYLIGFSPYANGSYLISTSVGSFEEYALYCSCQRSPMPSRWRAGELRASEVSDAAYRRGYGSPDEVIPFPKPRVEATHIFLAESTRRSPRTRTISRPLEQCASTPSGAGDCSVSRYAEDERS